MMTSDPSPPMKAMERADPYNRSQEQKHFAMGDPMSSNQLSEARQRMILDQGAMTQSSMPFPSSAGMQGQRFDNSGFRPPMGFEYPPYANQPNYGPLTASYAAANNEHLFSDVGNHARNDLSMRYGSGLPLPPAMYMQSSTQRSPVQHGHPGMGFNMNTMSYGLNPSSSFLLTGANQAPSRFDRREDFSSQAEQVLEHQNRTLGGYSQGMDSNIELQQYHPHQNNLEMTVPGFAPLPNVPTAMPVQRRQLDSNQFVPPQTDMNPITGSLSQSPHMGGEVTDVQTFQKVGTPSCPMAKPVPMAMSSDNEFITPLHCFIRLHCVELFTATQDDVFTPSKGKRRPIQLHQVGIRCPHCHGCSQSANTKIGHERGSVYYPNNISSIYNATMNLLQRHLHVCDFVPKEIMKVYNELKADDARSGTSKRYWIDSALALGLFDTASGIRWCSPSMTPVHQNRPDYMFNSTQQNHNENPNGNSADSFHGNFMIDQSLRGDPTQEARSAAFAGSVPLVHPDDKHLATRYSFALLSQMRSCKFTEADRLGKRKGLPINFAGLACSHCYGGYGSGRFFPSTIKTMSDTSKTLNVLHSHMMKCRKCPDDVRERLVMLRDGHDEERARMKFGSQKAFFVNIWQRLHGEMPPRASSKRKRLAQQQDCKLEDDQRNKGTRYTGMPSYGVDSNELGPEGPAVQPL